MNGSGKHNNWSICGPDGKNWLTPGDNPHDNAKFLVMIGALIKAVDTHADLLRAAVATAGNDHRLGANEAPPAIISIFLGDQLLDVFEQIEKGAARSSKKGGVIEIGVSSLPPLPRDATDRNRTSPFAFTGNKFEFRAVGSNQSCAGPCVVLNTIVAESLDEICRKIESDVAAGGDFNEAVQGVLCGIIKKHKRVLFEGDNYSEAWHKEARRRGLPNLKTTPEALKPLMTPKALALFKKYGVFSERELHSRFEVYQHTYDRTVELEASCMLTMARTMILPAALAYQRDLADTVRSVKAAAGGRGVAGKTVLKDVVAGTDRLLKGINALDAAVRKDVPALMLDAMGKVRAAADGLEGSVPDDLWPLPSYAEMMFMM